MCWLFQQLVGRGKSTKILKIFALKGLRQHIIKTNNPSTISPDELLTVRFPDLKENQVIIPSTMKLTFNISLGGTDVNRTLVGNLGRNIIRKLVFYMIELLEPALFHSTIPIRASLLISIAHQKASKVYYSFLRKKGVPLNLTVILKNSLILR